jgi:hypothetical protein
VPDWTGRFARPWARTILEVLDTAHPWAAGHVSAGPEDCDVTPARLHPAFHGSFDWHSSVHMQWSALRLLGEAGDRLGDPLAARVRRLLDERLTAANGEAEASYLRERPSYERPYGWAWAAMLAAEAHHSCLDGADGWRAATTPVADVVADHLVAWLPRLVHPVRHGVHSNTAFALALAHEAFDRLGRTDVVRAVGARAREWYAADRDGPARWEPSGEDFLSPVLCEAELMRRVLTPEEFGSWLEGFLPHLADEGDPLLGVPEVRDRSDGRMVHLFGLALSRAWLLRSLSGHLPVERRDRARAAASAQVSAVEPEIVGGDLMSTHWLVSFALLAELSA